MMNANHLQHFIDQHQIKATIIHLAESTPTVAAAAAVMGVAPAQIIKSILFLANGEPTLVIASGLDRIDYKRLADHLSISRRRLKTASAQQVLEITGYPAGAVPPFGHKNKLPTLLEHNIPTQTEVYGGGGEINALMHLTTTELQRIIGATILDLAKQPS